MDPIKRPNPAAGENSDDLAMLFYKSGRSLKNLSVGIGRGLNAISNSILLILLFLLRNILWLAVGTCIGLLYGIYVMNKTGTNYSSETTVKTNFNSATSLYNTMDYLNALVSNGDTKQLAEIFNIDENQAKKLRNFSASSVETELIASELYKDRFLAVRRGNTLRQDTFWLRSLSYEDFKQSLTKFDYPYHTITVVASDPNIFASLQQGITSHISKNSLLQDIRASQMKSNKEEEQMISSAIDKLDTLRQAYNSRLTRGQGTTPAQGNQLTVMDASSISKTPELDLYDKMLELGDELKKARARSATENDILEIYSPFNPVGQKISFLRQSVARYSLLALITTLGIILMIGLYKSLVKFERSYKMQARNRIET